MSNTNKKSQKYPNSFLFGFVSGCTLQLFVRQGTQEPLCARPFSYLRTGLFFMVTIGYWDYFRRQAMEQVMQNEEAAHRHRIIKAVNTKVRFGEEDEISNLTDYLAGYTTRL